MKIPFKVDETSQAFLTLKDSIAKIGITHPITVRQKNGFYEIISGHRRTRACKALGIEKIPAIINNLSDMESTLAMVDSNIQRDGILPSEKAFAYKMKLDAISWLVTKNRELAVSQNGTPKRSDEILAEQMGESRNQIQRFIRLTKLDKPLLQLVDDKKIPVNAAVELSFLLIPAQQLVMDAINESKIYPNQAMAKRLKTYAEKYGLNKSDVETIFRENAKPENPFSKEFIKRYFPKDYSDEKIGEVLKELLTKWNEEMK